MKNILIPAAYTTMTDEERADLSSINHSKRSDLFLFMCLYIIYRKNCVKEIQETAALQRAITIFNETLAEE